MVADKPFAPDAASTQEKIDAAESAGLNFLFTRTAVGTEMSGHGGSSSMLVV